MHPPPISTRPAIPADMPAADHAQPPQEPDQRLKPPRKGALPYTREEYRALPTDRKSAALDFFIEGIVPNASSATGAFEKEKNPIDSIVSWCIAHGEDAALEFLYRESGASWMRFVCTALDHRAFEQMRLTLQSHPQVKLHLSRVLVSEDAASDLGELIRSGRVAALDIDYRRLSNDSMRLIAQALQSDNTVATLSLVHCKPLDRDTAQALGEAPGKNTNIKNLHFENCDFGPDGWAPLLKGLQSNRHVKALTLQYCRLESGGSAAALGELLAGSTTLETVKLWIREFHLGAASILGGLERSRSIKEVMIAASETSFAPMEQALKACIARNSSLKKLDLRAYSAPLWPSPVQAFVMRSAEEVVSNTTLLSLPPYAPGTKEARIAADALERNAALANDAYVKKAAAIFHELPDRSPFWIAEGASDTLARHILKRENNIADFAEKMAHVELALQEQLRRDAGKPAQ